MKKKLQKTFFLILFLLCFYSVSGENSETTVQYVTLEKALELGMENNPDIIAARRNLESLARDNTGKWNTFLPNLSLNGSYSNSHNADSNTWKWSGSTGVTLSFDFGIPSEMTVKTLEYQKGVVEYEKLVTSTMNSITNSFYSLITEKNNIDILIQAANMAEEQYNQDLTNYNRGLVSELALLQSRYAYISAQPDIDNAKSTYEANLDSFKVSIGLEGDIELVGSLEVSEVVLPDGETLIQKYTEQNYDVQQQALAVEIAVANKRQSTASTLAPTFTLSENLSLTEGTQGNPVNLNGTFTAAVSIPLTGFIPYSSSNLALKKLEDQVESAEDTLALTIKETQNSLSLLPDKLARLWDAIGLAEMNYSISQKAYQLSEEGYESGLVSQTDLNTARQQLTTAQQSLYETQRDYLSALYDAALLMNISVEELITQYGGNHDGR